MTYRVFGRMLNLGAQYGVVIQCCEEIYFRRLTAQASAKSGVLFRSNMSKIIQDVDFVGCTFDPGGVGIDDASVKFENADSRGQATGVAFTGCTWNGETTNRQAISDYGSTSALGSVNTLRVVSCAMSSFVGAPVHLGNARHVLIESTVIKDYNNKNWYTGDEACAVYLGQNVTSARISGIHGGGCYGRPAIVRQDGVRSAQPPSARILVQTANGGLPQGGSLYVAAGQVMDRLQDDGSFEVRPSAASYTYDLLTSGRTTLLSHPLLSANQVITLPGANDGVPTGFEVHFVRQAGATGPWNVTAGPVVLAEPGTFGRAKFHPQVGWAVVAQGRA